MISTSIRPLSTHESRWVVDSVPLLSLRRRALAKREASAGQVEVLELSAASVWSLISCDGPSCCPNTWLIDAGGDFVYVRSWTWLGFAGDDFPGREVVIERLPLTGRILSTRTSGPPVPVRRLEAAWEVFDEPDVECAVVPREAVDLRPVT